MGQLYKGDTGKTLRVNAGFDMSSYTELSLVFHKPNNTTVTKTTTDGVTLGLVNVTDEDLGTLTANEYVYYDLEANFLDTSGRWCVYLVYTNTAASPDDVFNGAPARFTVKELC
jgi:hypothetical protein